MLNPQPNNKESFSHFNEMLLSSIVRVGFSQKLDNDGNCYYIIANYTIVDMH